MSSILTDAQAETFNVFAAEVAEYLNAHSAAPKNSTTTRIMETDAFLALLKTVSRPSGLRRVMQTQKFFAETGKTKKCFQKRDEQGNLLFKDDEKTLPLFTDSCCVMYTNEAYRAARHEITGLTAETAYMVPWTQLPGDMQYKIASSYFPRTMDMNKNPLPRFIPTALGIVLRKGAKVKKGEKRHAWAGFDFLVAGVYGDSKIPTVITQVAVPNKPYLASFAELLGVACPDWGQNDVQPEQEVSEELSKAACGRVQWATILDNLL